MSYICVFNKHIRMRNIVSILVIAVLSLVSYGVKAQSAAKVVFCNSSLDSLFLMNTRVNHNQASIDGYRIQIYSGSGPQAKKEAMNKRNKMLELFPNINEVYVVYNAPFWRVRVGNFRDRCEAMPLLNKIKLQFPGTYAVRDNAIKKTSLR